MLLAVLEKRSGFRLMEKDVFLNIAGGLRTVDPAVDLAVISAVLSSSLDIAVPSDICLCGEVGLAGRLDLSAAFVSVFLRLSGWALVLWFVRGEYRSRGRIKTRYSSCTRE